MANQPRLPSPPADYQYEWSAQFSRVLEKQNQDIWNQFALLNLFVAPSYTTAQKVTLDNRAGQIILDTTLGKLCFNTGAGWETITSAP